jgi:peptidoglycan/LPS O-acetylase OafA/YrhL
MLAVIVPMVLFLPDKPFLPGTPRLFFSGAFLSDTLIGLLLTVLIWLFDHAFREARVPDQLDAGVRWFADHTFSLYLYHFPLLCFVVAVIPFDRGSLIETGAMLGLILLIILGLGVVTESKRPLWRAFFGRWWDFFADLYLKHRKWMANIS